MDDTVPYVVYLKESIEQLVEEAEILRKKLESTKYKNIKNDSYSKNTDSSDELERFHSLIEEKDGEISVLKEELSKYEKNQSGSKNSAGDNDLNFTIEILKNENKELKEKLEEVSLLDEESKTGSEGELRKHNLELNSKIEELKKQLSDYEIIEDELSELKILKEENSNLKEKLSVLGVNEAAEVQEKILEKTEIEAEEPSISIEDIEKDFKDIVFVEEKTSSDSDIKSQIEKEIDEELNQELEALESKKSSKLETEEEKNGLVDLDLEFVGLPTEEDTLIEAEIQKLDKELEQELEIVEPIVFVEEPSLNETTIIDETKKDSDNKEEAVKIENDPDSKDMEKVLADEFEKFLSES